MIDGVELSKATGKRYVKNFIRKWQVVFQDPASNLNPRQTVESSIMRPMIIHGVSRAKAREKAKEVIRMVKME